MTIAPHHRSGAGHLCNHPAATRCRRRGGHGHWGVSDGTQRRPTPLAGELSGPVGRATVTGTVSSLQPTLPELVALGRLPPGFPAITPSQQSARIDIQRTNCPGANCTLTATACLTTAYQARGRFREDLATVAMDGQWAGGRRPADNLTGTRRYAQPGQPTGRGHGHRVRAVCGGHGPVF